MEFNRIYHNGVLVAVEPKNPNDSLDDWQTYVAWLNEGDKALFDEQPDQKRRMRQLSKEIRDVFIGEEFLYPKGVFAAIFRYSENGSLQVFLVRRNDYDIWNLPGGGVDGGETQSTAVVREALEETGLKVEPLSTAENVYSPPLEKVNPIGSESREDIFSTIVCYITGGKLMLNEEASDMGWFSLDKLPHTLFEKHRESILRIASEQPDQIKAAVEKNREYSELK